MNGKRYLLDTNAVIALLRGDDRVLKLVREADWVGISVIAKLEFLSFAGLSSADRELFRQFESQVEVIGLAASDHVLHAQIVAFRTQYKLKLPDAIIAAVAASSDALLVTADANFRPLGSAVAWI